MIRIGLQIIILTLFVLVHGTVHALYLAPSFGQIVQRADVIVTGTVTAAGEESFHFFVADTLLGDVPGGSTLELLRGNEAGCMPRPLEYEPGQLLVLFLQRVGNVPGGRGMTTKSLGLIGAGGEARFSLVNGHLTLPDGTVVSSVDLSHLLRHRDEIRVRTLKAVEMERPRNREEFEILRNRASDIPAFRAAMVRSAAHRHYLDAILREIMAAFWFVDMRGGLPDNPVIVATDVRHMITELAGPQPLPQPVKE